MEVVDAYQEYVQQRREVSPVDKIVTVNLPIADMAAIETLLAAIIKDARLPSADVRRWQRIGGVLTKAIDEVL